MCSIITKTMVAGVESPPAKIGLRLQITNHDLSNGEGYYAAGENA